MVAGTKRDTVAGLLSRAVPHPQAPLLFDAGFCVAAGAGLELSAVTDHMRNLGIEGTAIDKIYTLRKSKS
jgi:hypothetical protein